MIYLDNAATTQTKPQSAINAVVDALMNFGDAGRGTSDTALDAGRTIHATRTKIANLFNGPSASQVVFTANITEALNLIVESVLEPGDSVVTTAASHNSILRPLYRQQKKKNINLSIVPINADGSLNYEAYEKALTSHTKLVIVTHGSNVTGDIYDISRMASAAHTQNAIFALDTAQTAGSFTCDMEADEIDILAFTGHKGLFGPQGTGGLCVSESIELAPLCVGGTGIKSYEHEQPKSMPTRLEAGTLNGHGIAGLGAGVEFVMEQGINTIHNKIAMLTDQLEQGIVSLPGLVLYGGHHEFSRAGIVAFNYRNIDSAIIADILARDYGIASRAGAHCAPLMHEALGTKQQGIVRLSLSYFTTEEEILKTIEAITQIVSSFEEEV